MSKSNFGMPRWWRKFNRMLVFQDIITGRKVIIETTMDDGTTKKSIEVVPDNRAVRPKHWS